MHTSNQLSGWLNTAMLGRRISQAELARSIGVADAQVSRWRRGQVVPSVLYMQRLADAFGVQRATLEVLAGYPNGTPATPSDSVVEAELQEYQARLREAMKEKLPRSMWRSYVQACEALADSLCASANLSASLRDVLAAEPKAGAAPPRPSPKRTLGFQTLDSARA